MVFVPFVNMCSCFHRLLCFLCLWWLSHLCPSVCTHSARHCALRNQLPTALAVAANAFLARVFILTHALPAAATVAHSSPQLGLGTASVAALTKTDLETCVRRTVGLLRAAGMAGAGEVFMSEMRGAAAQQQQQQQPTGGG